MKSNVIMEKDLDLLFFERFTFLTRPRPVEGTSADAGGDAAERYKQFKSRKYTRYGAELLEPGSSPP